MVDGNPTPAQYQGVDVDHPSIVSSIKECKKQGMSKERASQIVGMPMEVVDKYYHDK